MTTRRVESTPAPGPGPALWTWRGHRSVVRTMWNYALMAVARVSPSFRFKNALYRAMGAAVGERVAVGMEVTFDVLFPELIEIHDDVTIGYDTTLLCHEYLRNEHRVGKIVIEGDVTVGANTTVLPGVRIGKGATVSAMSLVNKDIPPGEFWGGVPARRLRGAEDGADAAAPR